MRISMSLVAVLLLLGSTASAQAGSLYRVLLPVYYEEPVAGAFGSQWKTAWAVHNPTASAFHIEWCPGSSIETYNGCSRILIGNAHLAPGDTETTLPPFTHDFHVLNTRGGPRLLYIQPFVSSEAPVAGSPAQLSFNLRAMDISRSATNAGTETPVVRQEQFRKETTSLLNVPTDPAFRLTFRMYETRLKAASFAVRVYDQASNALLSEKNLGVSLAFAHHWLLMFEPPFLQIGDFSDLVPAGTVLPPLVRIEVQPLSEGSEFWAFVSITNNETQHLTLVTPQ